MTTRFLFADRRVRTAVTVLSFGQMLFGPLWTTVRFDVLFGEFLWMQRTADEPFYFWQFCHQFADGSLDINYRFFSKLLGALLLSMGATFDQMVTAYAFVNPVLAFAAALVLAGVWERWSVGRVIWALLLVLSFDLLSGSNVIVNYDAPAGWLANLVGDPALLKMDFVNFFMVDRRPEPQSSWIVLFLYLAALLGSFLGARRGLYIGVCAATPLLSLIYINVAVVAVLVFVQLSVLAIVVYRRPIVLPFGLSLVVSAAVWGVIFVAGSNSAIAAQSTVHTHLPILRPSMAMAVAGLVWVGGRIVRSGIVRESFTPGRLAAAVFFAVPLITLDHQLVTGITVMPQNWEIYINYICLVVGTGLMSGTFLSSFDEMPDWRRFLPLGLWAVIAFTVVQGEIRNESWYVLDNARSVVFSRLYTEAKGKVGRVDAVILPHLFDDSLFVTRVPKGTVVLGGYNALVLHQPPVWRIGETLDQHANATADSFVVGFETLFRTGVSPEQLQKSMHAEIDNGNCWPSLMYFFSLNDCWPAFLNYTSPATGRLAGAIPALVAMYRDYIEKQAPAALTTRQVLLIRTEPLAETTMPTIDNRLIASVDVDIRGKRIQAYAYLQRPVRP